MTNDFIITNELMSLLAPPIALVLSAVWHKQTRERFIVFGQLASAIFAFMAAAAILISGLAPSVMQTHLLSIKVDAATSCLLVVSTFISAVVIAFSDRYMNGDKTRLSFMRNLSLISTAATFLIVSDNMIIAFFCWLSLSTGLWLAMRLTANSADAANSVLGHQLASDTLMFLATALCISSTGVVQFSDLPGSQHLLNAPVFGSIPVGLVATGLLVTAFGIKSALFPFHRWLLSTLEAPTPLSGLLHAGVVNVSAVMAWKFMPMMQEYTGAMLAWGIWSGISAIVGTLCMSSQPDVKRKLAYSTVGQMGFMSLQCATGAVSAALFHLIAHGLFKCHLFLQSGSGVSEGILKRKFNYHGDSMGLGQSVVSLTLIALLTTTICYLTIAPGNSTWTVISTLIAGAALLSLIPALNRIDSKMLLFFGLAISALAIPAVLVGTQLEGLVKVDQHINAWLLPAFLLSFAAIAILKDSTKNKTFGQALYVHSLNGFYASEAADLIFRGSKDKNKTPRFATLIGYKTNTNGAESK